MKMCLFWGVNFNIFSNYLGKFPPIFLISQNLNLKNHGPDITIIEEVRIIIKCSELGVTGPQICQNWR